MNRNIRQPLDGLSSRCGIRTHVQRHLTQKVKARHAHLAAVTGAVGMAGCVLRPIIYPLSSIKAMIATTHATNPPPPENRRTDNTYLFSCPLLVRSKKERERSCKDPCKDQD